MTRRNNVIVGLAVIAALPFVLAAAAEGICLAYAPPLPPVPPLTAPGMTRVIPIVVGERELHRITPWTPLRA